MNMNRKIEVFANKVSGEIGFILWINIEEGVWQRVKADMRLMRAKIVWRVKSDLKTHVIPEFMVKNIFKSKLMYVGIHCN